MFKKEEFQGSEQINQIHILNLRKSFEVLRMGDMENVKDFTNRVMKIVNQVKMLGEELIVKRVLERSLCIFQGGFEAKISSFAESNDFQQFH